MNYTKILVCFANSRKMGGRCVAGKEWLSGKPGKWIRPVSDRATRELEADELLYPNGHEPHLLDIVCISCRRQQPLSHQRENHVINPNSPWTKQGALAWSDIEGWLDAPDTLWGAGSQSSSGINNRLPIGQENGTSLCLVSLDVLRLLVGPKAPANIEAKRAVRGEFVYRGTKYRLDVTDPDVEREYLSRDNGRYAVYQPVICVSLGDLYNGYFYKLIAAVLHRERFT